MKIVALANVTKSERDRLLSEARRIFFETANTKKFQSDDAKAAFEARWFGRYAELCPSAFLLALDEDRSVIGYVAGCFDSFVPAARAILNDVSYYTPAFIAAVAEYPSHFHINVSPGTQGRGIGRALLTHFADLCHEQGSPGIHVATGAASPAVKFYEACNYKRMKIAGVHRQLAVLTCVTAMPRKGRVGT